MGSIMIEENNQRRKGLKRQKCMEITGQFCKQLAAEKSLIVSMLGNFCTMMMLIAGYQFGAIVYNEEYEDTK